jgi:hypothetical protein
LSWDVKTFLSLNKAFIGAKGNVPVGKSFDVHEMMSSIDLQKYTLARGVCTLVETTQNYHQQSSSPNFNIHKWISELSSGLTWTGARSKGKYASF